MADQDHSTPPSPNEEDRSTSEEEELAEQSSPEHHDDKAEETNPADSPNDEAEPNLQANPTTQTPNESSSESPESAQSEKEEEAEEGEEEEEDVSLSPSDQQQQEQKEQEKADEPEEKEETEEAEPELSPGESTDSSQVDETPVEPVDDGHPFHLVTTPSNQQDETPEEQKSQRDLDDEEIPPAPLLSAGRSSFSSEKRLSQSSQPTVNDGPDEEQEDVEEEKENVDPSRTNGEIHLEQIPFEEIEKKEMQVDNEVLPPLEPTSIVHELLLEQRFVDETITAVPPTSVEAPAEKNEEECPWEDLLSNRTLLKQTIRKGGTNSRPTRSQLVTVNFSLALLDEKSGETKLIEEKRNEEFFVGETDIIAAIDLAVQSMDEGEVAAVVADLRHAYGNEGFAEKGIPPKSEDNDYKMQIQLELIQFRPAPNVELLSADERILWAEKKRQNGNVHYRRKDYSASLQCYRGSLRFLDLENNPLRHDSGDEERKKVVDQFIQVQNNVAQVNLTLKRYDLCLNAVENVLRVDRTNIKALFRQGKSLFELGQYDRCLAPLRAILQLDPNHVDRDQINKMIAFAEQKLADYRQNEKDIYRRMFQSNASSATATTTATATATSTAKTPRKIVLKRSSSSTFWTYVGLGTVTVSLVGLFAFLKYRQAS